MIESNKVDGYPPTRFIQMTGGGYKNDLPTVCADLIMSGSTLDALMDAFQKAPAPYLTIEDYVSRFGKAWGFNDHVVENAQGRVPILDKLAGGKRYA